MRAAPLGLREWVNPDPRAHALGYYRRPLWGEDGTPFGAKTGPLRGEDWPPFRLQSSAELAYISSLLTSRFQFQSSRR